MTFFRDYDFEAFLRPPTPGDLEARLPTILGLADPHAATIYPIVAYWIVSLFYEMVHYFNWFPQYQVYSNEEEEKRNLVSRWETLRVVLIMHAVQIVFGIAVTLYLPLAGPAVSWGQFGSFEYFGFKVKEHVPQSTAPLFTWMAAGTLRWTFLCLRQLATFLIFDTWAYWFHYIEHVVPFLYRHIHSVHHYNYVPYSYAASYNHPIEGLLNDILGSFVAAKVTGLSDREALVFFTVASIKAVDDHASMELPFNPIRIWGWFFGNGMVHHNIHHQMWGLKSNYGLYFTFWDRWNNTLYKGNRQLGAKSRKKEMNKVKPSGCATVESEKQD